MPSTELGLAEIGERLRSLCRRSNRIVVTHAAAAVVTVMCLSLALRFGLGGERFQGVPAWFAVAACLATAVWAILYGRTHWIDVTRAARLADQQGKLHDRLTTLLALAESGRGSRLLPVLLSQSLELGERWQPQRLLPQSYPKSVYIAAVALLVMATSPLLEPEPPPQQNPPTPSSPDTAADQADSATAPEPVALAAASLDAGAAGENGADKGGGKEEAEQGQGKGDSEGKRSAERSKAVQGKLTGNVPALGAKPSAQLPPQPGGDIPQGARTDSQEEQAAADDRGNRAHNGDGKADDRKGQGKAADAANQKLGQKAIPSGKQDGDASQPQAKQGEAPSAAAAQLPNPSQDGNKSADKDSEQQGQGSSPGAGAGSEATTILTVRGGDTSADAAGLDTFKLTLNSFLDRVEDKSNRRRDDKRSAAAGAGEEGADPARPEKELDDDALRKVTIPAEYEEIIKRVYARH